MLVPAEMLTSCDFGKVVHSLSLLPHLRFEGIPGSDLYGLVQLHVSVILPNGSFLTWLPSRKTES